MQTPPALKGAVSVGLFKTKEAADAYANTCKKKGVANLQVIARESSPKTLLMLRGTPAQLKELDSIQRETRRGSLSECGASSGH